jgi:hypothetical protein
VVVDEDRAAPNASRGHMDDSRGRLITKLSTHALGDAKAVAQPGLLVN